MRADTNFAELCPDLTVAQWCADPTGDVCCGICPNIGISGLGGHISLAFSSLSSIAAISLSPASAPSALVTNLVQANAYALVLLGYLLTNAEELDFFHAAYALLLAFSSLIPLTAIAASPPWAVTGAKSPAERSQEAESVVMMALSGLEEGNSDEEEKEHLIKKRKRQLRRALRNDPDLLLEAIDEGQGKGLCGIPGSHWMLYLGMSGSVLLWGFALTTGILGGANGSTKISLAQANCTAGLGDAAQLIILADVGMMVLAVAVFIAIITNHLVKDLAGLHACPLQLEFKIDNFQRQSLMEYSGSPQLVFGASFAVWSVQLVWMLASFTIYFKAGNANLLSAGEFSWTFGTTFSILMNLIPIYSIFKTLWNTYV